MKRRHEDVVLPDAVIKRVHSSGQVREATAIDEMPQFFQNIRMMLPLAQVDVIGSAQWNLFADSVEQQYRTKLASEPFDQVGILCENEHALYVYGSADASETSLVWDARHAAPNNQAPVMVRHPETGSELILRGYSDSQPEYPLMLGDRVLVPMTETRAHHVAGALLSHIEATNPERFAHITQIHPDRESAIAGMVRELLTGGDPDMIEATSGMLEGLAKERADTRAAWAKLQRIAQAGQESFEIKASRVLAPYMRDRFTFDPAWQGRSAEEAFANFETHECFRPTGAVSREEWLRGQSKVDTVELSEAMDIDVAGKHTVRLVLAMRWVGLDFTVLGEHIRIGPMLLAQISHFDALIRDPTDEEQHPRVFRTEFRYVWHDGNPRNYANARNEADPAANMWAGALMATRTGWFRGRFLELAELIDELAEGVPREIGTTIRPKEGLSSRANRVARALFGDLISASNEVIELHSKEEFDAWNGPRGRRSKGGSA